MRRWFAILAVMLVCGAAVAGDEREAEAIPEITYDAQSKVFSIRCKLEDAIVRGDPGHRIELRLSLKARGPKTDVWYAYLAVYLFREEDTPKILSATSSLK